MGIFHVIIFMAVIATLAESSVLLFLPCAASGQVHDPKSLELFVDNHHRDKFNHTPSFPRKLIKINKGATTTHDVIKGASDNGLMLHRELLEEASSGNTKGKIRGENVMHASTTKETWKDESSEEYYTMDYNWVRMRRPIHNKQIPFSP